MNHFTSKEFILKNMKKHFPMAAIDIETAKYYQPNDITELKLKYMFSNDKLSEIISLSIVSINQDLKV